MALSSVIETLLDHARSEARRQSCESILAVHLVAGLRRWKEEQFDQQFPNLKSSIESSVLQTRGQSIQTPKLEDALYARVEGVKSIDQLWTLARELVIEVGLESSKPQPPVSPNQPNNDQKPNQPNNDQKIEPSDPGEVAPAIVQQKDAIPLGFVDGMAERVAEHLGDSRQSVVDIILSDLAWIHSFIIGRQEPEAVASLFAELLQDGESLAIPTDLSSFIEKIDNANTSQAKRLASQLAFAYADIAEWFAALDDKFEEVELDRIDELKDRLLLQLDGVVDAEVSATKSFDAKFDNLVGMQKVKADLRKFVDLLVVQRRKEKRGMKVSPHRMHMAFLGNPGTGKTTVARRFGELLHELGLMNSTRFVEVAGTDFTGVPHIGESEPVMRAAVKDALDGVLFIDEAYSMNDPYNSDNKKGPGLKATDVLVKMMEDHRHQLCVIFAGYTDLTKEYLQANPGMPSRIGIYVEFPDYTEDDIKAMIPIIAKNRDLQLGDGALEKLALGVEASRKKPDFGNARSVEKILEEAERNCVSRVSKLGGLATRRHLSTIEPVDVPDVAPPVPPKRIGFAPKQTPGYL